MAEYLYVLKHREEPLVVFADGGPVPGEFSPE